MLEALEIQQRMFEAAFLPENWISILDDLAARIKSGEGAVSIYWPRQKGIKTSSEIYSGHKEWEQSPNGLQVWLRKIRSSNYVNTGFFQLNPSAGDWSDMEDYDTRLKAHHERGYGVQVGSIVKLFNDEICTLEFSRHRSDPVYDRMTLDYLNLLQAAFYSSMLVASRFQFESAKSKISILNDLGLPAALVSSTGFIDQSNDLFEGIRSFFLQMPNGRIELRGNDDARVRFSSLIEKCATNSGSIALPAMHDRNAVVIHVIPICRDMRSIFSVKGAVLVVTPVDSALGVPSVEVLNGLFGLTLVEGRLATALASGLSLRDAAAKQGVTFGTARSYLMRIFAKTGTSQQSELVSLLKGQRIQM